MTKGKVGQLNPELIHQCALAADPPATASGQLAWRLGQGRVIGMREVLEVDASRATLSATVSALRRRGWTIRTVRHVGQGRATYVVEQRPDGAPAATVHAPPAVRPRKQRTSSDDDRLRTFHRPAPVVPALGTVVRVSMIAEDNGSAAVVLTAMDGARWFARMEGADHGS